MCSSNVLWFRGSKDGFSLKRPVRNHQAGWASKKCTRLWRQAHETHHMFGPLLGVQASFFPAGAMDFCQTWGLCDTKKKGSQPWGDQKKGSAIRSIRAAGKRDTSSRHVRRSGAATWPHFAVAGAILSTDGMEKTQNAMVRGPTPHFCRKSRRIVLFSHLQLAFWQGAS